MCWDTHPEHHTPFRLLVEACRAGAEAPRPAPDDRASSGAAAR
jgi:hypothetical protein